MRPTVAQNPTKACLTALLFAASLLHAETVALKNFTLIDGTGRQPLAGAAIIIDAGRILRVGPVAQLRPPAGAQTIDLAGRYVIPGIINLHGHLGNTIGLTQDAKFFTRANIEKNLAIYASYGVTAVLSLGTDQDLIFQIRDQQLAGRPSTTRIFTAGQGFIFKGGYGGIAGVNQGVSSVDEVEPAVAIQAHKKVDFIKLWVDDELGKFPKMPYPIAKAIIDAAHQHHLRAVAHIFYLQDAKQLADYGVDGLAHSVRDKPADQELIDIMRKRGVWQMAPTLSREASMFIYASTPSFLSDPFFMRGVSPSALQTLRSQEYQGTISSNPHFQEYPAFLETAEKNLKRLAEAGVRYGFGTDTGPPGRFPGYFEHWEMELMVEAGLTPMQVLTSATRNAAEFLGAKDLGTLEPTKCADLIVLDQNPLEDIKNTRTIHSVYIAGKRVR
jgi:imidazolonepropionase-like amidohydrolase